MSNIAARSKYLLEAESLPEFVNHVTEVKHDYFNKTVSVTVLDTVIKGIPVIHSWILKTIRESRGEVLTLQQQDADGNLLYKKVMKGVKLVGHVCKHDYSCEGDDLQDHELLFTYQDLETV